MKPTLSMLLILVASSLTFGQKSDDRILGKWITEAGNCLVQVYREGSEYKAKILWFDVKGKKPMNEWYDIKNPDMSLRSRKLVGMEVLQGLHYNPQDNEWIGGSIYDATTGKKWDSVVWMDRNNALKVKGYWLFRWISQTKLFKRVDESTFKF